MLEFHDPRGAKGGDSEPYTLGIDLARQNKARIAFLANGFPDSENFLKKIEEVLLEQLPGADVLQLNKNNASSIASDAMLDKMDGFQAAIAAYGH